MFTKLSNVTKTDNEFRTAANDLLKRCDYDEPLYVTQENGLDVIPLVYRDRDNYRLSYAIARDASGQVFIEEPVWDTGETHIQADFALYIQDAFGVAP